MKTKSEAQLKKFLKVNVKYRTTLELRGQGDSKTISIDSVNLCTVKFEGVSYFFGGISERFYDKMVDRFHDKIPQKNF